MKILLRVFGAAVVALCLFVPAAQASVVIAGTRVVFDAGEGEATVRLMNQNQRPALVEAWIDAGNIHATPDSVHTPFLVTPPLFRMEAGKDQNLRILYVQGKQPLPTDRESVFWLNVLEIPPKPTGEAAHHNTLQFAIRSRIKLFYRPDHLPMDRTKAADKLRWKAVKNDHGAALQVHNPTPYYLTLNQVTVQVAGKPVSAKTGMVAPFSDLTLALPEGAALPSGNVPVAYSTLNDFGVAVQHQGNVTP